MSRESGTVDFHALAEEVLQRVPGVVNVWFRAESARSVELRLELEDDSWDARERAIDELVNIRLERMGSVSLGYSFALPHAAYDVEVEHVASETARVHSFA